MEMKFQFIIFAACCFCCLLNFIINSTPTNPLVRRMDLSNHPGTEVLFTSGDHLVERFEKYGRGKNIQLVRRKNSLEGKNV